MRSVLILFGLILIVGCSSIDKPVPITPNQVADNERICVIGDGGTGDKFQYQVANSLEAERCTRILYVGDVVYEFGLVDEDDKNFISKFYLPYKKILDSGVPFYMSMGNHDWYLLGTDGPWVKLALKYENIRYKTAAYMERFSDVCIFEFEVYKTSKWAEAKRIRSETNFDGCSLTIGFSHYPYRSAGEHGDASESQRELMEEIGVGKLFDIYVAGHDHHLADEGTFGKTRLFVSGSAGKLRTLKGKPAVWGDSVRGYLVINFSKTKETSFYFVSVKNNQKRIVHSGKI